jgi:hypothetical protein
MLFRLRLRSRFSDAPPTSGVRGRRIILSLDGDLWSPSYHTLMSFVYASKNSSTLPETMKMKIGLNRILDYRGPEVT